MKRARDKLQVQQIIDTIEALTDEAVLLRRELRRSSKPGSTERESIIKSQLNRIRTAMAPVRSEINRAAWYPVAGDLEPALRAASRRAQREAKKLRKLLV